MLHRERDSDGDYYPLLVSESEDSDSEFEDFETESPAAKSGTGSGSIDQMDAAPLIRSCEQVKQVVSDSQSPPTKEQCTDVLKRAYASSLLKPARPVAAPSTSPAACKDKVTGFIGHFRDGTRAIVGLDTWCEPNLVPKVIADLHPEWPRFALAENEKSISGIGGDQDSEGGIEFEMAHRWGADFITHRGIISAAPYEAILLGKHEHRTQGIIMFPANDGGVERALFQYQKLIVILDAVPNIINRLLMPPLNVVLTNS